MCVMSCVFDVCGCVTLISGWTPLICASINDHLPVVKFLLKHKANVKAKDNNGVSLNSTSTALSGLHVHDCCVC